MSIIQLMFFSLLKAIFVIFLFFGISPITFAEELPPKPEQPLYLTSTQPEHLNPEYWINKLPNPDKLLKTPEELKVYNDKLNATIPQRQDIFKMDYTRSGRPIRGQLQLEYDTLSGRILLDENNVRIPKSYFETTIKPRVNIQAVPSRVETGWGVATQDTSVRALPTMKKMIEGVGDIEFDQLQFTLIKTWTPVAILHSSAGGDWYYIRAPYTRGWVKAEDIALFPNREEIRKRLQDDDFVTVTGPEVMIYGDPQFQTELLEVSMGTELPLLDNTPGGWVVSVPKRSPGGKVELIPGYLKPKSDTSFRHLPLTQRNLINQAFKLLGARYGWGGQYKGRDCSGFTHDVFLSLGLAMPRNSGEQGKVGNILGTFEPFESTVEKAQILKQATPATTLLRMPMHLMLYLGEENGHFYIIHSTWAERINMDKNADLKRRINQVVVTDTSLNGKSYLGSLFDRTVSINEVV